jgi:phage shock protein E
MSFLSFLGWGLDKIKEALRKGAVIIDVRTANEFDMGKVPGSVNIPVDRIAINSKRIKGMDKAIIFCCNSGHRSRQAMAIMKEKGLKEAYVVGNWERLLRIVNSLY